MKISSRHATIEELKKLAKTACENVGIRFAYGKTPVGGVRTRFVNILLRHETDRFCKMNFPHHALQGWGRKRISGVCWKGWVEFFDEVFRLAEESQFEIFIKAAGMTEDLCGNSRTMIDGAEHWSNIRQNCIYRYEETIGSSYDPYSEMDRCHCHVNEKDECMTVNDENKLKQEEIEKKLPGIREEFEDILY